MASSTTKMSVQRLRARLAKIPLDVRAAASAEALLQAQWLGEGMKAKAPIEDGDLRESIRVEGGKYGDRWLVKAGGPKTTKKVRNSSKGGAPEYDYALASEFGRKGQPARPWFYPTYRIRRAAIKAGIAEAAKRAAKRSFDGGG